MVAVFRRWVWELHEKVRSTCRFPTEKSVLFQVSGTPQEPKSLYACPYISADGQTYNLSAVVFAIHDQNNSLSDVCESVRHSEGIGVF